MADTQELMKQIVARMPTDKGAVFSYPIAWATYDGAKTAAAWIVSNQNCESFVASSAASGIPSLSADLPESLLRLFERQPSAQMRASSTGETGSSLQSYAASECSICDVLAGIGPEGKNKISQWVTKTIKELLGEEEQTLVRVAAVLRLITTANTKENGIVRPDPGVHSQGSSCNRQHCDTWRSCRASVMVSLIWNRFECRAGRARDAKAG